MTAAKNYTIRLLGREVGETIRKEQSSETSEGSDHDGKTVRPHVRRAHWHGFWTGKRNENKKFILKWLPPIAVAMNWTGD